MEDFKRILIRTPNWVGDQILAYPFFYYLRKAYPKAWIAVACPQWVEAIQFRGLINEVFVLPKPIDKKWKYRFQALEEGARILKEAGPWELGISLPNSFSSAWLFYRSEVKVRRGYQTDGRSFLLHQKFKWNKGEFLHRSEAYVGLLPEAHFSVRSVKEFWGVQAENDLDLDIPGELQNFNFKKEWGSVSFLEPPEKEYWVMAPGAVAESRRWPAGRFAALADAIFKETGLPGLIVGGPVEAPLASEIIKKSDAKLLDWTAQGSVSSYAPVFQKAKFTVSNDSGLAHVAALCGSSVQIIWGAGRPQVTEPLGPGKVRIVFNPVDCWPCERNVCLQPEEKKLICLNGIYADSIWEEIKTGLRLKFK